MGIRHTVTGLGLSLSNVALCFEFRPLFLFEMDSRVNYKVVDT